MIDLPSESQAANPARADAFAYDAFASYATDPDGELVRAVETALEGFHRRKDISPQYLSELELCVDGRDFRFPRRKPDDQGKDAIEQVVRGYQRQSRALIVFTGPGVLNHPWIDREIEWWAKERPDGPVYLTYTHGPYPDQNKKSEFMPKALIARGGPDNSIYFDLRGFHRSRGWASSVWLMVQRSIRMLLGAISDSKTGSSSLPTTRIGDMSSWRSVRSFEEEVSRICAQLVSDAKARTINLSDLVEAYASADRKAKARRRNMVAVAIVGILAVGILADRLRREQETISLTNEAQKAIDNQELERALRIGLEGLPYSGDMPWALGSSNARVRALRMKVEGAAQLSAFVAKLQGDKNLTSVSFSSDGSKIVTSSEAGTTTIWDAISHKLMTTCRQEYVVPQVRTGEQHTKANLTWVRDSRFSNDGIYVVSVGPFDKAWVWNTNEPDCKGSILLVGHTENVRTGAFSPDGTRIVTTSDDDSVRVWWAKTGAQLGIVSLDPPSSSTVYTTSAEFSPDGKSIVISRSDGLIGIADASTYALNTILQNKGAPVRRARFSPDGRLVVTASDDGNVSIWDLGHGTRTPLPRQFRTVGDASFSPDGHLVVTASADHTARIWDSETLSPLFVFRGHSKSVSSAQFSPDGRQLITASTDGTARIWDAVTNVTPPTVKASERPILSMALSQDGTLLATTSLDGKIVIWRIEQSNHLVRVRALPGSNAKVTGVSFGATVNDIATASADGSILVWNLATGLNVRVGSVNPANSVSVNIGRDGSKIVVASDTQQEAEVLDLKTHEHQPLRGAVGVTSVEFSGNGQQVLIASEHNGAGIWDCKSGDEVVSFPHASAVTAAHFNADGSRVVTASLDGRVRLWEVSGRAFPQELVGHEGDVNDANFSVDGTRVVTASGDHTVRVWDTQTGAEIVRFGMANTVESSVFTRDGTHVLAASDDGQVTVFDVSWTIEVGDDLAAQVCSKKLAGIETFSDDNQSDPILASFYGHNPCHRL
ncbi:hypothetical protein [Mesorhizobium sp. LjRoot246]|uniref:WD40 repeat domain-containing protein n=1 Tax=Mesorhizobium sp. LjRoot246 TaxID=3342294 RepID=UPI003ED0B7CE